MTTNRLEWTKRAEERGKEVNAIHKGEEVWRDIPNYPNYQLSTKGRVRKIHYLKPFQGRIPLTKDGKTHLFDISHHLLEIFPELE